MDRNTSYEDPFNDGLNIVISQTPEAKPLIIGTLNVFGTGSSTSLTNAFDDDLDINRLQDISVSEPYHAFNKNSDANITKHNFKLNMEQMTDWITEGDILIVDRGFRDAVDFLEEMGSIPRCLLFLKRDRSSTHYWGRKEACILMKRAPVQDGKNADNASADEQMLKELVESTKFSITELSQTHLSDSGLDLFQLQLAQRPDLDNGIRLVLTEKNTNGKPRVTACKRVATKIFDYVNE
ncbi:unnamed protein product [Mytilus edulis]|uniref:PML C-terminal domain-containing protein n=1 Tax=Mytilus edulis TaxID=6550 RepID=A0A8S3UMG6_MYTED|nr:unnamed protein product [Mytilus edulis]